jgi:outer membrane protein assembly factor BamB
MYLHSTPFIDNERQQIYVATEGGIANRRGDIVCLDINTATTKWVFPTKHVVPCSPTLINNMVICGSNDGNLYSLDPNTGELIWVLYNIGEVKGQAAQLDQVIIVTVQSGKIYGIDYNGKILWKRSCGTASHHQFLQVHYVHRLV